MSRPFAKLARSHAERPATSSHLSVTLNRIDLDRGGRAVLRDVSWRIRPGQRWLLIGGNGAGKTQLLKLLSGAVWPKPTAHGARLTACTAKHSTRRPESRKKSPTSVPNARIATNTTSGTSGLAKWWVPGCSHRHSDAGVDGRPTAARRRVVRRLGIDALAERRFLTLSYGERRLVLIARALASRPRLLLLDEVANGLDARHHARFLAWLSSTARSSMPWVFATHRRGDVPGAMTHLLELERGRVKRSGPMRARQAEACSARKARRSCRACAGVRRRRNGVACWLRLARADVFVDDVHILRGLNLEVAAGDCWVVHGANGSGKSTLLRTLYGDHAVAAGGVIERAGVVPGVPLEKFKLAWPTWRRTCRPGMCRKCR